MWMVEVPELEDATPSTVPHAENASEGYCGPGIFNPEMTLTGAPVWMSKVVSVELSCCTNVSRRQSGEKMSPWISPDGELKVACRSRVAASRISISAQHTTAMNLLHGDHATRSTEEGFLTVMLGSHEVDSSRMILVKGRAYGSYSFRTIDVWGDSGRAEW